ncbi:MAG: hypothetical protein Q7U38_14305, partial [Methylobacter sp.]|nr:hypothetical protein [Methylobacter sp.]
QAPAWRVFAPSWGLAFPATHLKLSRLKWVVLWVGSFFLPTFSRRVPLRVGRKALPTVATFTKV